MPKKIPQEYLDKWKDVVANYVESGRFFISDIIEDMDIDEEEWNFADYAEENGIYDYYDLIYSVDPEKYEIASCGGDEFQIDDLDNLDEDEDENA